MSKLVKIMFVLDICILFFNENFFSIKTVFFRLDIILYLPLYWNISDHVMLSGWFTC